MTNREPFDPEVTPYIPFLHRIPLHLFTETEDPKASKKPRKMIEITKVPWDPEEYAAEVVMMHAGLSEDSVDALPEDEKRYWVSVMHAVAGCSTIVGTNNEVLTLEPEDIGILRQFAQNSPQPDVNFLYDFGERGRLERARGAHEGNPPVDPRDFCISIAQKLVNEQPGQG